MRSLKTFVPFNYNKVKNSFLWSFSNSNFLVLTTSMHTSIQFVFIENISRDNPLAKFLVAFRWPPFSHTLGFHDTRMYWWVFQESRSFRMQWQQFFSNYVKPFLKYQLTMMEGPWPKVRVKYALKNTLVCATGAEKRG